jgi:tRNA-modifying protein YgfZ
MMTTSPQNNPTLDKNSLSGLTSLSQWGLILIEGADAQAFLQNQLTNSVMGLEPTSPPQLAQTPAAVRLVGYCNSKGRLLASAWLASYRSATTDDLIFALFISKDIAAYLAKRLSMYVLRSKVTVKDVSDQWVVSGYYSNTQQISELNLKEEDFGLCLPTVLLDGQSYSRILLAHHSSQSKNNLDEYVLMQWNSLEVLSAIPRIVLATQEKFVPQMINFESVAGVDFKKGCYPGQEIVARSQYRGAIKRRLQLAYLEGCFDADLFAPGVELYQESDPTQPAGMVVLSAPNPQIANRIDFQIECKLEVLEFGEIRLGSIDGPVLKIDSLPYPFLEI